MPEKEALAYIYYFHSVITSIQKLIHAIMLSILVDTCMENKNKLMNMRTVHTLTGELKKIREDYLIVNDFSYPGDCYATNYWGVWDGLRTIKFEICAHRKPRAPN